MTDRFDLGASAVFTELLFDIQADLGAVKLSVDVLEGPGSSGVAGGWNVVLEL